MKTVTYNFQEFCDRSGCGPDQVIDVHKALSVEGSWLAGGAIRRTLIKQSLDSDFDFFFTDVDAKNAFVSNAESKGFLKTRETKHHTQLEGTLGDSKLPVVVQAINFQYYTSLDDVLDSFDYTITQFGFDGENLVTTPYALWDLGRKRLAIHKITYPVATMRRMLKYSNQGLTACAGCMADLFKGTIDNPAALGELDIAYVD